MSGEFDLINRYFKPLAGPEGLGLADDCAYLAPTSGGRLISKDLLIADVHFKSDAPADLVASKSLRTNLSDVIASGGTPETYFLGLVLPDADGKPGDDAAWLADFAAGLKALQDRAGIRLAGGDITRGPVLMISITIVAQASRPVTRSGARAGDVLAVTNNIGGPAIGLLVEQGLLPFEDFAGAHDQLYQPAIPFDFGPILARFGHGALDVSDGLLGDAAHLARCSNLVLEMEVDRIPLHPDIIELCSFDPFMRQRAFRGGDDYQTLFTCAPADIDAMKASWPMGTITKIGSCRALVDDEVPSVILRNGQGILESRIDARAGRGGGYSHVT